MKLNKRGKTLVVICSIFGFSVGSIFVANKVSFNKNKIDTSMYNVSNKIVKEISKDPLIPKIEKEIFKNYEKNKLKEELSVEDKVVYITIDDGPSKYTDQILDLLKKHDVPATFFMLEPNMKTYAPQVQRLVNEGHSAGFHSVTHDKNKLYVGENSTVISEFNQCQDTFYDITSTKSNLIRLPYGSKPYLSRDNYKELVNLGYKIWDWNVDSQDWRGDANTIFETIKEQSANKQRVLFLVHEKQQTVDALEKVIVDFKNNGYTFAPIRQNDAPINYWVGV